MDPQILTVALAAMAQVANGDLTADDVLAQLCELAKTAFEVDATGVMITEDGLNRFVAATANDVAMVERVQELQQGPCHDASIAGRTVVVDDLDTYPAALDYRAAATREGFKAVLAVPLTSRGRCWGVLDLYRRLAQPWQPDVIEAASLLADVTVSYLVMAHDRDAARLAEQRLAHLALHDPLTGLANRTLVLEHLSHALAAAHRRGRAVAVLFIDVDRFKSINDSFGHAAGDFVLQEIAARLQTVQRAEDTMARLAGDEFLWLCTDIAVSDAEMGTSDVDAVIARARSVFDAPIRLGLLELAVTASIGVAISNDLAPAEELIAEADTAMYGAKGRTHGDVVIRDHTRPGGPDYALRIERELVHALERGEFALHYQPIVTANQPYRIVAVEALLRWQRTGHGLQSAAAFIDILNRNGLIISIGRWVIDQACAQVRAWTDAYPNSAPQVVFINLSTRELADPHLLTELAGALLRYGISADRIGLEILEDNVTDGALIDRLTELRRAGHPLAIDDFGTGYSSLSRLVDFQVNYTKIDKAFIAAIPADQRRVAVVRDVLSIASTLSGQVVAEGVETPEQRSHLAAAGCHLLQGYLLGQPQSAAEISALLHQSEPETLSSVGR